MKDLVVKISGSVQENNLTEFKESALAILSKINTELVTSEDFAIAEKNIKDCKLVETRIANAKQSALHGTKDIMDLFDLMDECSEEFRKTRLDLEKLVKSEKLKRKGEVVTEGIARATQEVENSPVAYAFTVNVKEIQDAVKGLKTIDSMKTKVDAVVESEIDRLSEMVKMYQANSKEIQATLEEYPGLFPDKKQLCVKPESEVSVIIESRVNKYKLDLKEKEERAKKAEEERLKREETERIRRAEAEKRKEAEEKARLEYTTRAILESEKKTIAPKEPLMPDEPPLPFSLPDEPPMPEEVTEYPRQTIIVDVEGAPDDLYSLVNLIENQPGVVSVRVKELEEA